MRLIVWDFDGTLADSQALIVAGMEHALAGLGLQDLPGIREKWLSQVGLPVETGLERTFESLNVDTAEVLRVYRTFDWVAHEHLLHTFKGMPELIHELHGRGVKMAIASSKRTTSLTRQLATFGWTGLFHPLVTPDDVTDPKPHPESLEICLRVHGLAAHEAVMVGDTPFDLEMAERAGMPAIAVGHGFCDQASLLACRPTAYAADVPELRRLLLSMVEP